MVKRTDPCGQNNGNFRYVLWNSCMLYVQWDKNTMRFHHDCFKSLIASCEFWNRAIAHVVHNSGIYRRAWLDSIADHGLTCNPTVRLSNNADGRFPSFAYVYLQYKNSRWITTVNHNSFYARSQNSEKRLFSFVLPVCPYFRPHATTRLPFGGFSWNIIFDYFSKICPENSGFITIWQE
jgi:hypothetical protein